MNNPSVTQKPYERHYRWVVLAGVWLLYASFGLCMRSVPPVVTPILADLNMTYGEMGFVLGSWQLFYIPFSLVAGFAIDRWGIRKSLFAGGFLMALSEGLRFFVTGYLSLLPVVAVFGIGGPLVSIGAPKVGSSWFRGSDRAKAVGIYTSAPWIGGLFSIAATNSVIMPMTGGSWRLTLLIYGCITLLFTIIWGIFARDAGSDEETTVSLSLLASFKYLFKVRTVRIVLLAGLLTLFGEHGFYQWLPKMLEVQGFTPETAGYMTAIPLVTAIPSVLLIPRFVPAQKRGKYLSLIAVVLAAGLFTTFLASTWLKSFGLVAYGLTAPTLLPMLMLVLMDDPEVGARHMGKVGGLFFCIAQIGGFSGPLLAGRLIDITGSFLPGILVFTGTGIALGILALFLKTAHHPS